MSHQSTHLRTLAKPTKEPKTSMDPTHKKHPKSPPFTTTTTITKPHPKTKEPPKNIYSPNVQNISNNFSRLYTNHKALSSSSGGHPHPQPCVDTHFQAKAMSVSTNGDNNPVASLIMGSRKFRRNVTDLGGGFSRTGFGDAKVKEKEEKSIKNSSEEHLDTKREILSYEIKEFTKKEGEKKVEEEDCKKKPNQELEVLKGFEEGCDIKRPSFSVAEVGGCGGRRRSFCSSQTELANFLSCNGVKVVSADMPPFMQIHAVDCARKTYDSLEKFTAKTLASTLKKEFDGVYGPAWHCIVGTSFGSFVTHSVEKTKQDDSLSDLSNILGELKNMAVDMGSEIERHNKLLKPVDQDLEELIFQVDGANQRARKLLGK